MKKRDTHSNYTYIERKKNAMNNKTNATDFSAASEKTTPTTLIENNFSEF